MKNLKKVLALVMAFAMAFTMMAGAAYTDQDDIQATDAVELLATLNVMTGKGDGMFHPNDTITRAEICRIIYTIRNEGNDNANAYADMQTSFQDLTSADDWAKGYIKHCQSVNLISGRDAAGTIFGPQDPVTGVELAVICLRVLGYDPAKAGIGGESWSTKTIGLASEAGLLKGVNMESVTGPCERQWAAQIMANMLDARTVRWSTDGDRYTTYAEDGTDNNKVGREYMKLHTSVGTLISVSGTSLTISQNVSDRADSDPHNGLTAFTNVNKDYSELLGQKVKVLYSDGKANSVIGVYGLSGNTVYTVNASAVESDGANKVKFDGKSYTIEAIDPITKDGIRTGDKSIANNIDVAYMDIDGSQYNNTDFTAQTGVKYVATGNATSSSTTSDPTNYFKSNVFDDWNNSSAVMKFVDSDNNGRLDQVIITDYAAAEVTSATSSSIVAGKTYNHSDELIDEDIKQGDWVSISYNRFEDCKEIKKIDVTTGKLDGLKKDSTSEGVNDVASVADANKSGKKLKYNEYRVDNVWFNNAIDRNNRTDINTVTAGDDIEYILLNGTAWKIKRAGSGNLEDVVDVAMVVSKDDKGVNGEQVKLQFFNDTTAVVNVDNYREENGRVPFGKLQAGKLYEYSVSGGKYIFENLKSGDGTNSAYKDYYGAYTYIDNTHSYTLRSDKIATKTIDDKAKVILYGKNRSGNMDSDVITGRQLRNILATEIGNTTNPVPNVYYFTADIDGLNRAAALAMSVDTLPNTLTSNDYYGYILSDAIFAAGNNEISYDLLLENGETVTVWERSTRVGDRLANTLIGYKSLAAEDSNSRRYIDDVTLYSVEKGSENFGIGAITSVNNSQTSVEITGPNNARVARDVANDTVVFYVNTDAKTGATTGTIRKAVTFTNKDDMEDAVIVNDNGVQKVVNCLYLIRDNDDLEVLVVEQSDDIFRGPDADYLDGQNASLTMGDVSVKKGTNAVFTLSAGSNFSETDKDVAVTIDGASATPTFDPSDAKIKANENMKITITTSSLAVGDHKVMATADGKSVTATLTVTGTPIDMTTDANKAITLAAGTKGDFTTGSLPEAGAAFIIGNVLTADEQVNAAYTVDSIKAYQDTKDITNGATLTEGNLSVVITLKASGDNTFASDIAANAVTTTLNGVAPVCKFVDSKTVTLTYTYTIAPAAPTVDGTDATKVQVALNENDVVEASGVLTTGISVPANKTLVVADNQTTLSALTGNGNVVFNGNIANASGADSLNALMGSLNKVAPTVAAGNNAVAIDDGLKLSGTGEVVVWNTGESFSDMAAATGSKTVTPVEIVFTATQAPVGAKIKATGTLKTAYNGSTTWPLRGAYSTGDGFEVTGTPGDTAQLMVGDNCASITFTITIPAVAPATEPTVTTYTFTF